MKLKFKLKKQQKEKLTKKIKRRFKSQSKKDFLFKYFEHQSSIQTNEEKPKLTKSTESYLSLKEKSMLLKLNLKQKPAPIDVIKNNISNVHFVPRLG